MLKRVLIGTIAVGLVLLLAVTLTWYLAFFAGPRPPKSIESPHVSASVSIAWSEDGPLHVDGQNMNDVLVGMGYGMGRARAWQLALWRQAALGRLSEWFGDELIPTDRLMRQLQIGEAAKQDLASFPEETKVATTLLTQGLNAALNHSDVARGTPFLLLGIEPEPWEAWHSLAVEKLFVWLGSNPFADTQVGPNAQDPSAQNAVNDAEGTEKATQDASEADKSLRSILQMDGFGFNTITASPSDTLAFIAARYVTGSVSIPFFVEVEINTPQLAMSGIMVPGTLVTPMGITSTESPEKMRRAWSFLLTGSATVAEQIVSAAELSASYQRIETTSKEDLVLMTRFQQRMPLVTTPRDANTGPINILSWNGFTERSDFPNWLDLLRGKRALPLLIHPDGVLFENGTLEIIGNAPFISRKESGEVFLASLGSSFTPQERFGTLGVPLSPESVLNDAVNQHASESLISLLSFLPDSVLSSDRLQQGVKYLRNWNDEYDNSEIGASIFNHMVRENIPPDSTAPAKLERLLDEMSVLYGADMSAWRWENVHKRKLLFPGTFPYSVDAERPVTSFNKKFGPIEKGGPGHPQTFVWGSAGHPNESNLASAWEGAINFTSHDVLYRRPYINYSAFLGPFLSSDRPISINYLSEDLPTNSTTIVPDSNE